MTGIVPRQPAPGSDSQVLHIFGLGAVGTLVGLAFARAGWSIHTYSVGAEPIRCLRLYQKTGSITVPTTHHDCLRCIGNGEAVLLGVKWPQVGPVLSRVLPALPMGTRLILPQNGIADEELNEYAGRLYLMPLVVNASAERLDRGVVTTHGATQFLMGGDHAVYTREPLERLGFRFLSERELRIAQILKLLIACTSAYMAVRSLSIGCAFGHPRIREDLAAVVQEGASVFLAHMNDASLNSQAEDLIARIREGTFLDSRTMASAYTSMHSDLNVRGQRTEVSWVNGFVVRLARRQAYDAPLNASLLNSVRELEDRAGALTRVPDRYARY